MVTHAEHRQRRPSRYRPGSHGYRTWLSDRRGSYEADERDVGGATGLQRDGVNPEVFQHVEDGLEPEVLDPALAVLVQGQTQVLQEARPNDVWIRTQRLRPPAAPRDSPWPSPGS